MAKILNEPLQITMNTVKEIEKYYNAKYICETCLKLDDGWSPPIVLFYQPSPNMEAGHSNWFGIYVEADDPPHLMITNGIRAVEPQDTIQGLMDADGTIIFSRHVHDFRTYGSMWVDGGRDYVRCSADYGTPVTLKITPEGLQLCTQ